MHSVACCILRFVLDQERPAPSQKATHEDRPAQNRDLLLTLRESDTRLVVAGDAARDCGEGVRPMVASAGASDIATVHQPTAAGLADGSAASSSIAAYLSAGERMLRVMDLAWQLCAALFVLVALAWAFGAMPGAVRLF